MSFGAVCLMAVSAVILVMLIRSFAALFLMMHVVGCSVNRRPAFSVRQKFRLVKPADAQLSPQPKEAVNEAKFIEVQPA